MFHIFTRSASPSYYARILVPVDLRAMLRRREVVRSLGTGVYREAQTRAGVWGGQVARLFIHLREVGSSMTMEQINILVQHYLATSLEECEEGRLESNSGDDDERDAIGLVLSDLLEETTYHLMDNNFTKVSPIADELLAQHKVSLAKDSPSYRRLCRELLKAQQVVFKTEMERLEGRYWTSGYLDASGSPIHRQQGTPQNALGLTPALSVGEALKLYFEHYGHRLKQTNEDKVVVFRRFTESLSDGEQTLLTKITKADCIRFRDSCSKLPKRVPKSHRGKPMLELVEGMQKDHPGYVHVTKSTVNQALTDVRHFFTWAIRHDHYTEGRNPVDGIDLEGVEGQGYEPYTDEELSKLFSSPEFKKQKTSYPARYWLPLVLLYSGARREEIAQLAPSDVKRETGVHYFDVAPEPAQGKRLKNKASKRRVPVHAHLVELGLLDYLKIAKNKNEKYLFPKQESKSRGRETCGDSVSKWFLRLRDQAGVSGRKTLHSFRHTVVTRLAGLGVPEDIRKVLVGHADDNVHGATYLHREQIPLTLLQTNLNLLCFPHALKILG